MTDESMTAGVVARLQYLETFLQLSEFYAAILALFQGGLHKR